MSKHFTHLHLHTDFSLLDGAITLDNLIKFGQTNQLKAMAITDHGNIFGAVKFFQKCKKAGIKPILGMEAYLTEDAQVKIADKKYYHLILLVQNAVGYKNLCKLISYSFKDGFYFKPRIDYRVLEKHSEGLIATTACLGGHIPQLLINNQDEAAIKQLDWYLNVFGKDRFFLEVQPEDQAEQTVLNKKLYDLHARYDVNLVATGDCHYVAAEDREAHEVMLAIQTHDKMDNPNRYTFGDCRVYMRTQEEMLSIFKNHESAVWNTGFIADQCSFDFETGKLFFPKFEIPESYTPETYFKALCQRGLDALIAQDRIPVDKIPEYQQRLDLEADLIIKMGFVGYFLVVSDFIQWARRNNIPVGPGRGSAAGSLVAWALEITNIDPIRYNLLFERFLNPERVTMPDIDIDFCIEGRESVINYVRDRYGHNKVCQIITFGTMMAKGVVKDVARTLGFSFEDSNAITNLIPEQLKITLKEAFEQEPQLAELQASNPNAKKLFDIAFKLEGLTRHASKHAAGIVISPEPIDEVLPVYVPPKTTELVTQYAMTELESLGFLKMDLLGLKNLTLIDRAVKMIEKNHGVKLNIDKLPLDDPKTFALLCEGKTSGVFQLESDGLKEVLRKLQPDKFEDIIAVNALYRPGPLGSGMVDDYIERRHGRQEIKYLFPELAPILEETYGVIVYQEQVMKIASTIGGYSLGEADILRRAMGKKKADVMAEQRHIFLTKAQGRGFDGEKAGELFDLMAYFAGYGFNKSHSAAYALIAYQTAYLKANYAPEFMACLISLETKDAEKMAFYLQEAKDMGIKLLPPSINTSEIEFTVVNNAILFGLQGIKSVGHASLDDIIAQRRKKPFVDMMDLCKRIDLRTSNKRVLENLIYAGALDCLPGNRAQKLSELAHIMELAADRKKAESTGQMDLFGTLRTTSQDTQETLYAFTPMAELPDKEKLEKEKEVIGFYLSSHPLDAYQKQLKKCVLQHFTDALTNALNSNEHEYISVCTGLIKSKREITTKKGDKMAFVQLEDASGTAEIILFPRVYQKVTSWLDSYHVFVVKGSVDTTSQQKCKIKANDFIPVELLFEHMQVQSITLKLPHSFDETTLKELKDRLVRGKTTLLFRYQEQGKELILACNTKITIDSATMAALDTHNIGVEVSL
jgi:DNA polymerase-3 subunit alpha